MRTTKMIMLILTGLVAGILLVLSCGDNSPRDADAAVCDCPAAEAPIPARIIEVQAIETLPPRTIDNGRNGQGVGCPNGSVLLTGGCTASEGQVPDIVIEQNSPTPQSPVNNGNAWSCSWRNNSNEEVVVRVIARCLMPAS
ncbi:MAG: hypothetical protein R3B48_09625 [Kofleriaceae bacterium]